MVAGAAPSLRSRRNGPVAAIWLAGLVLACMALAATPPVHILKLACLDQTWRLLRALREAPAAADVVIIGVDEASIAASGKPFALMQDDFAALFDTLRLAGVRAVGLDLILPPRSYGQLAPGASERLALAMARLRDSAPVVIGAPLVPAGPGEDAAALYQAIAGNDGVASLYVPQDADGMLRRAPDGAGAAPAGLLPLSSQLLDRLQRPHSAGMVDFTLGAPLSYLPMAQAAAMARAGDLAGLRARLAGRVVLIGAILPDQDRQRLPVALAAWEHGRAGDSGHAGGTAGVVFQAQLLRSQLARRMVQPVVAAEWLCAALCAAAMWTLRRRPLASLVAATAGAVLSAAGAAALLAVGWYAAPLAAWLVLACGAAWAGWRAYRAQRAGQRRMRSIFSGYVSPAILDTILSGDLRAGLASRRQPLAFLFADLRGFTAFCNATPPDGVIAFLNRYYAAITVPLHRHGGTIDKFSGDGVMVFFGAPAPSDNPCRDAVLAALGMLDALAVLNRELQAEGSAPVALGIGIAYGDAVLGNVGCAERHDYTATGAATALAAHIQQWCKGSGYALLVERGALQRAALPQRHGDDFDPMTCELAKHGPVELAGYPAANGPAGAAAPGGQGPAVAGAGLDGAQAGERKDGR